MNCLSYFNQERTCIQNIDNILFIDIENVAEINGRGNDGIFGLHDIVVCYYDEYQNDRDVQTIGRYSSHHNALEVLNLIIDNIDENYSCVFNMPTENEDGSLNFSLFHSSKYGVINEKVSQNENLEKE